VLRKGEFGAPLSNLVGHIPTSTKNDGRKQQKFKKALAIDSKMRILACIKLYSQGE